MQLPSFKEYLELISEDAEQEVNKIMADLSAIDAQIAQRTQPLLSRKQQLQKLLFNKRKQLEQQQRQQQQKPQQQQTDQMNQATNQTTTPGGSGAGTPGSSV